MAMERKTPVKSKDVMQSQILQGGYLQNMEKHKTNNLTVPKVFFCIVNYFTAEHKHLKVEGLFRRNGAEANVQKLITHL